jgi:hypothetical protein
MGAVTAFLAVDLGAVAYANKWIGPNNTLTRETFLNAFRSVFGAHPGIRTPPMRRRRRAASDWRSRFPTARSGGPPC